MLEVKFLLLRKVGVVPMFSSLRLWVSINSSSFSPLGSLCFGSGPHKLLCALQSVPIISPYLLCLLYCIIFSSQSGVGDCLWCRYILEMTTFCPLILPAIVVAYWFVKEGSRLKLRVLFK